MSSETHIFYLTFLKTEILPFHGVQSSTGHRILNLSENPIISNLEIKDSSGVEVFDAFIFLIPPEEQLVLASTKPSRYMYILAETISAYKKQPEIYKEHIRYPIDLSGLRIITQTKPPFRPIGESTELVKFARSLREMQQQTVLRLIE